MVSDLAVGGLASGLDTNGIIEKLMSIEQQPLDRLKTKEKELNYKNEMVHEINTDSLNFQNKVFDLSLETTFMSMTTSSSDEDVVTATAGINAVSGMQYNISDITFATQTIVTSEDQLNTNSITISSDAIGVIDTSQSFADAGFSSVPTGTVMINGSEYDISNYSTVDDFINAVKGNSDISDFSYDNGSKKFTLTANPGTSLSLYANGDDNFFNVAKMDFIDPEKDIKDLNLTKGAVTSGSFKINGANIYVNPDHDSINDIIDSINESEAGVSAFYDSTTEKINISSKGTGQKEIVFDDNGTNFLNATGLLGTQNLGKNAEFKLNGVQTSRSSNSFTINDVNFTLKKDYSGAPITVTTEANVDNTVDKLKEFVDDYNALVTKVYNRINEEVATDDEKNAATTPEAYQALLKQGLLNRDSVLRDFHNDLKDAISTRIGDYTLEELGITSKGFEGGTITEDGKIGLLEVDEDKLREVLKNDPNGTKDFFVNKGGVFKSRENITIDYDGTDSVTLANYKITERSSVMVNNKLYNEVADPSQFDSSNGIDEFYMDHDSGEITFENPLNKDDEVRIDYNYINYQAKENSIDNEEIGVGNGAAKSYKLDKRYITDSAIIKVDGVEYEEVASIDQLTDPEQYYLDHDKGTITFSNAISSGDKITADYKYILAEEGFANDIYSKLKSMTGIGVFYQTETSYDQLINQAQTDITNMQTRLDDKEDQLWSKYSRMEQALSKIQSQGQWLSGQLSKLG